jgi:hypothetical protein
MKTKTASIIAAVIGSLCAAFAIYVWCYQREAIGYALTGGNSPHIERVFWWPLTGAVIFFASACLGFIWHRKHRHDHAA